MKNNILLFFMQLVLCGKLFTDLHQDLLYSKRDVLVPLHNLNIISKARSKNNYKAKKDEEDMMGSMKMTETMESFELKNLMEQLDFVKGGGREKSVRDETADKETEDKPPRLK